MSAEQDIKVGDTVELTVRGVVTAIAADGEMDLANDLPVLPGRAQSLITCNRKKFAVAKPPSGKAPATTASKK